MKAGTQKRRRTAIALHLTSKNTSNPVIKYPSLASVYSLCVHLSAL